MKYCPKCNTGHELPGIHCSRSCANSRGPRSDEFKEKVRQKLSGKKGHPNKNKGKHLTKVLDKQCPECHQKFTTTARENRKFCSTTCRKPNLGGYREGSGRAKTGYYKGIYCGSTYELVWVIYNLDHNVRFSRFVNCLEKDGVKYYPDFISNGVIIEIKGYESEELVRNKTAIANFRGYDVVVLRKDQLQQHFEWVKKNYVYKKLHELYDGYKPSHELTCSFCNKIFTRDSKPKSETNFCSRTCAGKGHKGRINRL